MCCAFGCFVWAFDGVIIEHVRLFAFDKVASCTAALNTCTLCLTRLHSKC